MLANCCKRRQKIWSNNVIKDTIHSVVFESYLEIIGIHPLFIFDESYTVSLLKSNLLFRTKKKSWIFRCHQKRTSVAKWNFLTAISPMSHFISFFLQPPSPFSFT